MNDEQYFLANGYLDGVLDADEIARAEADPAVMAEVEVLRRLQAALRHVDPPSAPAREAAVTAALAEFDRHRAAATAAARTAPGAAPSTSVVPFRSRPAMSRWLSVAAAVAGIGLLGVLVTRMGTSDDEESTAPSEATAQAAAPEADASRAGGAEFGAPAATVGAFEQSASEAVFDVAATEAAPGTGAPAAAEAPAEMSIAAEESAAASGDAAALYVFTSPSELQTLGSDLRGVADENPSAAVTSIACQPAADIALLGDALYSPAGEPPRVVVIGVVPATGVIVAIDPTTCAIVLSSPPEG